MADSNPKEPGGCAKPPLGLLLALLTAASLFGAPERSRAAVQGNAGPIALDAQSSELDLKNNNVFFRKVRIAQGNNSVTADQGQASREAPQPRQRRYQLFAEDIVHRDSTNPNAHASR